MKSFPIEVKLHGLRPDKANKKNSGFALSCLNFRAKSEGLEGYEVDINNLPHITYGSGYLNMSIDWPFPQVFQTDSGIYVGKRDGLYKVSLAGGTLVATQICSRHVSWPWTLANCPMFPVFASGDCFVYYDYDTSAWTDYTGVFGGAGTHWAWPPPVAACFVNGQIITCGSRFGGGTPSNSRSVRWSEIGAFRFSGCTADDNKNEAGFMFAGIDDSEILLRCLPLKKRVIIYGTFGIFALRPVESPAPTFGVDQTFNVWNVGIVNPLAVGGSEKKHLMVDREGYLWQVDNDIYGNVQIKKVGYEEYLGQMQKIVDFDRGYGLISIVFNEQEDEYYISDGNKSFLFNGELTQISKNITSYMSYRNANIVNVTNLDEITERPLGPYSTNSDEGYCYYQTDTLDANLNAIKTLETVELIGTLPDEATCDIMVEARVNRTMAWRETKWVRINPSGYATPTVSGAELRVNIRVKGTSGFLLEGLRCWWKLVDKRGIRGNYASATTARSDS